jgi:hypothetical protein
MRAQKVKNSRIAGRSSGWGEASLPSHLVRSDVGTTVLLRSEAIGVKIHCIGPRGSAGRFAPPLNTFYAHIC